jgi:hypothetical protein
MKTQSRRRGRLQMFLKKAFDFPDSSMSVSLMQSVDQGLSAQNPGTTGRKPGHHRALNGGGHAVMQRNAA